VSGRAARLLVAAEGGAATVSWREARPMLEEDASAVTAGPSNRALFRSIRGCILYKIGVFRSELVVSCNQSQSSGAISLSANLREEGIRVVTIHTHIRGIM